MKPTRRPADLTHRFQADSVARALALIGDHWTLMILREKVILYSEAGALPAHALEDIVTKAQALDMVKVHEEIAKERSSDSDPDA